MGKEKCGQQEPKSAQAKKPLIMSSHTDEYREEPTGSRGEPSGVGRVARAGDVEVCASLSGDDHARVKNLIDKCLYGPGGEVSERTRAMELGRLYLELDTRGRERFFRLLATEYDIDRVVLAETLAAWNALYPPPEGADDRTDKLRWAAENAIREQLVPPRIRLLSRFNGLPEGVKFLVNMRTELLPLTRRDPLLKGLDDDVKSLLTRWFDVGFLDLRRITWDAPASLLEKLARYEAVHAVTSWNDIKNRLAPPDRRCYAYFHPKMPNEPLIFVWVALVRGMSPNVQALLDPKRSLIQDPSKADTAIFYSISNAQDGLAGISFGNFLIKRVVKDLHIDYEHIRTFATLSPIPGFYAWLAERAAEDGDELLNAGEQEAVSVAAERMHTDARGVRALLALCDLKGWHQQPEAAQVLKGPLLRLCARYLTTAKRGKYARNRVAHFHLSNGARMERLNWLGDVSRKGIDDSAGIMINYLYRADDIEANHEAYTGDGTIAMSDGFTASRTSDA